MRARIQWGTHDRESVNGHNHSVSINEKAAVAEGDVDRERSDGECGARCWCRSLCR